MKWNEPRLDIIKEEVATPAKIEDEFHICYDEQIQEDMKSDKSKYF